MAAELLEEGGIGWGDLERLGVGVGPGTFTGLRVGVATARGLAQSLGLGVAGISSLRALAAGLEAPGGVLAVIDARRGEIFVAGYGRRLEELFPARALAPGLLGGAISGIGPETGAWTAVGDGALRYRGEIEAGGVLVPEDSSPLHLLRASAVCELAAGASESGLAEILPDYRRRPDAELALASAPSAGVGGR
jgi:tRNA threonylcarbamoyladenosine biosynthesis protein TsaB